MGTEVRTVLGFGSSMMCGEGAGGQGWMRDLEASFYELNPYDPESSKIGPAFYNLGVRANRAHHIAERWQAEADPRLKRREDWPAAFVLSVGHGDAVMRLREDWEVCKVNDYAGTIGSLAAGMARRGKLLFIGLSPCDESATKGYNGYPICYSNERLAEFEAAACKAVEECGGTAVPLHQTLMAEGFHTSALGKDGLHPTRSGYQRITDLVLPSFVTIVGAE